MEEKQTGTAMRGHCLSSFVAVLLTSVATSVTAAPWVRSYTITDYEPAFYYGGSSAFHKVGAIQPGSDCPAGSSSSLDYNEVLLTPWRNAEAVKTLLNPPHTDPGTEVLLQTRLLTYRGFRDGINTYINPFAAPDPGLNEVTGKIAEGFDLDHRAKTGGFTAPDGQKGIDNAFYRAWGCLGTWRESPYHTYLGRRTYDRMSVEGLFTFVVRVSGNKDPMNDNEATVEVGFSPDQMVLGGTGAVLPDYSYRLITNNGEYSKLKATVKNGVVETEQVDVLHAPRVAWYPNLYGDIDLHKGLLRLQVDNQGNVSGLVGGYRDWREIFVEHHFTQTGGHIEQRDRVNAMAMYYALKRNADGMPDPATGKYMGISGAYRFKAEPAYVVDATPAARTTIAKTDEVDGMIHQIEEHRAAFYKALATRQIQPMPADSHEGAFEKLHPQQQPDGSWKTVRTTAANKADRDAPTVPTVSGVEPLKPKGQQVFNGVLPVVVAAATK